MFPKLAIPVTILLLAGCSRQQGTTQYTAANQPPAVQPAGGGPGPEPAAPLPNTPANGLAGSAAAGRAASHSAAADNVPLVPPARYPVVSAEPADPPRRAAAPEPATAPQPVRPRPSAFEPVKTERKAAIERRAAIENREETLEIPAGTWIRVRLAQTLDTKYTPPGTPFTATLDTPIVVGRQVVVPKNTPFEGTVVESKSSGRFRGRAVLEITLRSFRMNGTTYRISTVPDARLSGSHKKRNLALMGAGPATGAGIGALAAGGPGALIGAGIGAAAGTTAAFVTGKKNVKLPVETPLTFSLRSSVQVKRV